MQKVRQTLTLLSGTPAISNGIAPGRPLPTRLKLLNWGGNPTIKGLVQVTHKTVTELPRTQARLNWDDCAIDIEHGTVPDSKLFTLAAANGKYPEILGRGKPRVVEGDGLYIEDIVWTDHGPRAYEFPDLSAAVKLADDGTVVGLHSAGFCAHGAAIGIHAYNTTTPTTQERSMEELIAMLLGLPADATPEQLQQRAGVIAAGLKKMFPLEQSEDDAGKEAAAIVKVADKADEVAAAAETLSALNAEDLRAKLEMLSTLKAGEDATLADALVRLGKAESGITDLSALVNGQRRDAILMDAARAGKKVPRAYLDKYGDDIETLSALVADLPATVPVEQRTVATLSGAAGARAVAPETLNPAETSVARMFGRTPEDLRKAGV